MRCQISVFAPVIPATDIAARIRPERAYGLKTTRSHTPSIIVSTRSVVKPI